MEVRIRSANEPSSASRLLAEIPFRRDAIDSVIPTLADWGVFSTGHSLAGADDLSGQFVDDGEKAYFEVIVDIEE